MYRGRTMSGYGDAFIGGTTERLGIRPPQLEAVSWITLPMRRREDGFVGIDQDALREANSQ